MAHEYAQTMFSEAARQLQQQRGSRAQYERIAASGASHSSLTAAEIDFISRRDSFYIASVNPDGWPYVQHRGGPAGFLKVIDAKTLAFADYAGNQQYISMGNVATNDRVSLFLMDYPHQARLKIIGHARTVALGADAALEAAVQVPVYKARLERIVLVHLVAYD